MLALSVFAIFATAHVLAGAVPPRIVGGQDTTIDKKPFQVSVLLSGRHNCGGSIINDYWILTAAHCIQRDVSVYTVRIGSSMRTSGGIIHEVDSVVVHERYTSPSRYSNDIGLIKLRHPIEFSAVAQPIRLPEQDELLEDDTMTEISGWGTLTFWGSTPEQLQMAVVPKISMERCQGMYDPSSLSEDMLCAGYPDGGVDACQGDSGGPLVAYEKVYGIVSWGSGCAWAGSPGVYSRVSSNRDWIRRHTGV
ncbi:trypsin-1-like [Cephus cinctus]|uniref:Trypsin-1-like n=1 Tax=Cephus cinctus TaxID=211228 RepID=A0AAJ7BGP8_CEPCN|nr:trypsin-1-like [Cephus cinctus]